MSASYFAPSHLMANRTGTMTEMTMATPQTAEYRDDIDHDGDYRHVVDRGHRGSQRERERERDETRSYNEYQHSQPTQIVTQSSSVSSTFLHQEPTLPICLPSSSASSSTSGLPLSLGRKAVSTVKPGRLFLRKQILGDAITFRLGEFSIGISLTDYREEGNDRGKRSNGGDGGPEVDKAADAKSQKQKQSSTTSRNNKQNNNNINNNNRNHNNVTKLPSLLIQHIPDITNSSATHPGNKTVWSSRPGINFVGAASLSSLSISESTAAASSGNKFRSANAAACNKTHIQEHFTRQYTIQTIDAIERGPVNVITFAGRLAHELNVTGEMDPQSPHYSLAFKMEYGQSQEHEYNGKKKALSFHLQVWGGSEGHAVNQSHVFLHTPPEEAFFGFGHRLGFPNAKGSEIHILHRGMPSPHGYAGTPSSPSSWSSSPSSCTIPQFVTSTGRALFLHNYEPSVFDLRSSPNGTWLGIRTHTSYMKGVLLGGESILDAIQIYTSIRGRTKPLPGWTQRNGVILGVQGGTKAVKEVVKRLERYDCPMAGVLVRDWTGVKQLTHHQSGGGSRIWYNWIMERGHYSHWHALVDDLEIKGISMGVYINPYIEEIPVHLRSGRRYLFTEAKTGKFFVKKNCDAGNSSKGSGVSKKKNSKQHTLDNDDGTIYPISNAGDTQVGLLDLTNRNACQWYKQVVQSEVFGYAGASFYMADMGETAPILGVYHRPDVNGLSHHNAYSEEWARVNREAIKESGRDGDSFFIVKAGYGRTPKYAGATCLGDCVTNLKKRKDGGLQSVLNGILNGGFSGFTYGHCAISFAVPRTVNSLDNRTKEMICRWMEMNAFTTLFRTHDGESPDETVSGYGDKFLLKALARWSTVYATLAEYRMRLLNDASFRGYPVVRHPILHFPTDEQFMTEEALSFMLGDSVYVAPIMKCGVVKTKTYIPAGRWTHLWSGAVYDTYGDSGSYVEVQAPLGEPPVFYKDCEELNLVVSKLKQKGVICLQKTTPTPKRFSLLRK